MYSIRTGIWSRLFTRRNFVEIYQSCQQRRPEVLSRLFRLAVRTDARTPMAQQPSPQSLLNLFVKIPVGITADVRRGGRTNMWYTCPHVGVRISQVSSRWRLVLFHLALVLTFMLISTWQSWSNYCGFVYPSSQTADDLIRKPLVAFFSLFNLLHFQSV